MARSIALGLLAAAMPAMAAQAAPATREGADALMAVFERYLGHPAAGASGSVTVVPEGESYRATFDIQGMARPFEALGFSVEPASQTFSLLPQADGLWKVSSADFPALVVHAGTQTVTLRSGSYAFSGTFDPKIKSFSDATTQQTASTLSQEAPTLSQERRSASSTVTQTGALADGGSVSMEVHYVISGTTDKMTFRSPPTAGSDPDPTAAVPPAAPPAPVEVRYDTPTSTVDFTIDKLRNDALLDVWAFLVAHPNADAIKAAQDELRGLLRSTLPVMAGLKEGASVDALAVATPVGPFSFSKIAGSIALTELAAAADVALALNFDGLKVPAESLPPWSLRMIPTSIDIRPTVSGLRLNEAAREAVDDFDLKGDGFTPAQKQKITRLMMPSEGVRIGLADSRVTSDLLEVRMNGEALVGGAVSSGRLSVTGTGLDKAIAVLQAAAGTDEMAGQVLSAFVGAKNLAKPAADGALTWDVEADARGTFTVNGVPMK